MERLGKYRNRYYSRESLVWWGEKTRHRRKWALNVHEELLRNENKKNRSKLTHKVKARGYLNQELIEKNFNRKCVRGNFTGKKVLLGKDFC